MTVFFAHVGDENSKRDFPRTIGSAGQTLSMHASDFGEYSSLVPAEIEAFQTWGIPAQADTIHRNLKENDWFVLIGTIGPGGGMEYIGKVLHIIPTRQPDLSKHLWTEERFPWVFLLRGEMRFLPWPAFLERIGYDANFDPRGRIFPISKAKMRSRGFSTDFDLISALRG